MSLPSGGGQQTWAHVRGSEQGHTASRVPFPSYQVQCYSPWCETTLLSPGCSSEKGPQKRAGPLDKLGSASRASATPPPTTLLCLADIFPSRASQGRKQGPVLRPTHVLDLIPSRTLSTPHSHPCPPDPDVRARLSPLSDAQKTS